ncbi:MAG: hypothetical protein J0I42_19535 [Bosea sp.]|uniref:hypothetical protein n=1 Tax=Bosea sp. (in: a-proteobacteria) TaxID=1871050 RepID=UPI001AC3BB5F|nr:hypothetical protein [Bosea sp. (in: a-proteobacteria)]MBN9454136.1 hypothetical protein [Bosea sp. (in: a-proteobacteria)]
MSGFGLEIAGDGGLADRIIHDRAVATRDRRLFQANIGSSPQRSSRRASREYRITRDGDAQARPSLSASTRIPRNADLWNPAQEAPRTPTTQQTQLTIIALPDRKYLDIWTI